MTMPFTLIDILLILVVTAQSVALAYVHSARAKSLLYMLPFPFTFAMLATGRGVDATHPAGILCIWAFPWVVYWLHVRWRLHILAADAAALALHLGVSLMLARCIPGAEANGNAWIEAALFWGLCGGLFAGAVGMSLLPHRAEPGHRSPLPVWVKAPGVFAVVAGIVLAKEALRGFMPAFPMVTIFAVYEARHSLYTLSSRFPIFIAGFVFMLVALRLTVPYAHPTAMESATGLAIGWALYVPVFLIMDRIYRRRAEQARNAALAG